MLFVGFGYLMTFLHRYRYSSLGFTFLVGVFAIEWGILVMGFFYQMDA
jgi:ammonium transporter Rh